MFSLLIIGSVLLSFWAQSHSVEIQGDKLSKYIIWLKSRQAVEIVRDLTQQGVNNKCNIDLKCDSFFEHALYGAICYLRGTQVTELEHCLGEELNDIQLDTAVMWATSSRRLTQKNTDEAAQLVFEQVFAEPQAEQDVVENQEIIQIPKSSSKTPKEELKYLADGVDLFLGVNGPIMRSEDGADHVFNQISQIGFKSWTVPEGLWNLDRIDQRLLPLNSKFVFGGEEYVGTGAGVTIYVVDSGIRSTHEEFRHWQTMGSRVGQGIDTVDDDNDAADCNGHGTHVASVAVGRGVGVAKQAQVVGVRVLNCSGQGTTGSVVKGLEWVSANAQHPAIVTLSLGLNRNDSLTLALEEAIRNMVERQNITFIVASGNSDQNHRKIIKTSCDVTPSHMEEVITVAASDLSAKFGQQRFEPTIFNEEGIYEQSNTGACVDIFAPGVDIYAACGGAKTGCDRANDFTYTWLSGTSMAVPHVAGAAAIFLGEVPEATPAEVKAVLLGTCTLNQVQSSLMQPGTESRLLYMNVQDMIQYYRSSI
eukprot:TRINITY_DN7042_c0_g1_i1.p1 TRINITY_DN7042_c0_g1~~TRINITY_DN7042_c0_g1_i1.p1  ORF type:complete len:534 (-),score=66.80 TRINITY_DN7042_c0_g1_i1:323-1924(-)